MQQFAFEATDKMGNRVSGTVSAPNEALATNQIGQMGYALISLNPAGVPLQESLNAPPHTSSEPAVRAPARLPLTAYGDRLEASGDNAEANATSEMPAHSRTLEPWERNAPIEQAPLPAVSMSATGAILNRTQPMQPGATAVMTAPTPCLRENGRGVESRDPFSDANKGLPQLLMEKMVYPLFSGVVLKDLAPYYRQFATLIGAGLPLFQSLMALEGNTSNPKLKEVTRAGQAEVQKGGRFSDVIGRWPWVFQPVQFHLLRASEESGTLEDTLRRIAGYVEHDLNIKRMVQREILYPMIVLVIALMILGRTGFMGGTMALVSLVLGGMRKPEYTVLNYLIDTIGFGLMILVLSIIPIAIFRISLFNVNGVRETYDRVKLGLPVIGKITRMFAVARFSRTLAALSRSGFGMGSGLDIAGKASGNAVLEEVAQRSRVRAERGEMFSETLRGSSMFPPMEADMIRTGETAGRMDEMLDKIAEYNESEGKLKLHQAVVVFGVVVFLIVALLVFKQVIAFYSGYGDAVNNAGEGLIPFSLFP